MATPCQNQELAYYPVERQLRQPIRQTITIASHFPGWLPVPGYLSSELVNERECLCSSLREILSHASDVIHLEKRCPARLCEVGTKVFFYLYRRTNATMIDTSAADANPLDESMDQY